MKQKTLFYTALTFLAAAAPLVASDPITDPMIAAINGSVQSTPHGDSLKVKLEENVMNLFAYREAGQSRHPDLLLALGHGLVLLRSQYEARQAAAVDPAQADSLAASLTALDHYQHLIDSLSQTP
jgi:hypothetical protein